VAPSSGGSDDGKAVYAIYDSQLSQLLARSEDLRLIEADDDAPLNEKLHRELEDILTLSRLAVQPFLFELTTSQVS